MIHPTRRPSKLLTNIIVNTISTVMILAMAKMAMIFVRVWLSVADSSWLNAQLASAPQTLRADCCAWSRLTAFLWVWRRHRNRSFCRQQQGFVTLAILMSPSPQTASSTIKPVVICSTRVLLRGCARQKNRAISCMWASGPTKWCATTAATTTLSWICKNACSWS